MIDLKYEYYVCNSLYRLRARQVYENRRRDCLAAQEGLPKDDQERLSRQLGENDVTDMQNPYFRYNL